MQSTQRNPIRAKDLMHAEVTTVRVDDSLKSAVKLLEDQHISGLPVLDASGALVGVFSDSDLERFIRESGGEEPEHAYPIDWEEDVPEDRDPPETDAYSEQLLGEERVGDWMSPGVIAVAPTATLREVCRTMSRESVHRVLVAQDEKLLGIVSSFDVVRCLATLD